MNTKKNVILDKSDIKRILTRLVFEILEKNKGVDKLALIGIQTRGVYLAKRIQSKINKIEKIKIPTGELNINLYRDDWTRSNHQPIVLHTKIPFSVDGLHIILVDDVLFTGRTIRSAMEALMDYGRPDKIELTVLTDRGHRELPIQADFVGKIINTRHTETVNVNLKEHDGIDQVTIDM